MPPEFREDHVTQGDGTAVLVAARQPDRGATAADWDVRVERALQSAPAWLRSAVHWLRAPSRRWIRLIAGVFLVIGGVFSILPILGLWMLPLGLALIGEDSPALKARLEGATRWLERTWRRFRR